MALACQAMDTLTGIKRKAKPEDFDMDEFVGILNGNPCGHQRQGARSLTVRRPRVIGQSFDCVCLQS